MSERNESPFILSYTLRIQRESLSLVISDIFEKKSIRGTKRKHYMISYIYLDNKNGASVSHNFGDIREKVYLTYGTKQKPITLPICTQYILSLFPIVFEIFEKKFIWPFELGSRLKVMTPNESPHMISYISAIKMESLAFVVSCWDVWEKVYLTSDLWVKVKGHGTNESPYMIS